MAPGAPSSWHLPQYPCSHVTDAPLPRLELASGTCSSTSGSGTAVEHSPPFFLGSVSPAIKKEEEGWTG